MFNIFIGFKLGTEHLLARYDEENTAQIYLGSCIIHSRTRQLTDCRDGSLEIRRIRSISQPDGLDAHRSQFVWGQTNLTEFRSARYKSSSAISRTCINVC